MTRPSGGGRRRRLVWAGLAVASLALAAVAVVLLAGRPGNVSNPNVEFDQGATQTATQPKAGRDPFADGFAWPVWGLTKSRTRYLALSRPLRPPFVMRWAMRGSMLIEFPPVLCGRSLFLLKNDGALYAISRRTGRPRWKAKIGALAASSPACGHGTVYSVLLARGHGIAAGRVVAVNAATGRTRWSRKLPSRSESSPLLDHGRLYFGTENGTVYALRASDGAVRWTYRAPGAVKGGIALDQDRLVFGDYGGHVTAIRRSDGHQLWQTGTSGGAFGLRSGNFYSTPAIAYGRVYIGNTDGFMYSFSEHDGALAWRHGTGNYVYSSPAVSPVRGGTVYVGSYDGKLYAFDARNGSVRWVHDAGGKISGSPVVVGDLVFYSDLGDHSTTALGAANGRVLWHTGRGAFNPVISDGTRLYLNGYSSLFMLTEQGRGTNGKLTAQAAQRRRNHARAAAIRRHRRYLARRDARTRAWVHRRLELRRRHVLVCLRHGKHRTCRLPRPPVCIRSHGHLRCHVPQR